MRPAPRVQAQARCRSGAIEAQAIGRSLLPSAPLPCLPVATIADVEGQGLQGAAQDSGEVPQASMAVRYPDAEELRDHRAARHASTHEQVISAHVSAEAMAC